MHLKCLIVKALGCYCSSRPEKKGTETVLLLRRMALAVSGSAEDANLVQPRARNCESSDDVIGYVVEAGRKAVNRCVFVEKPVSRRSR